VRRPSDQYNTPDELADWIVKRFGNTRAGIELALDPGSGGGAFCRALAKHVPTRIVAVEIDTDLSPPPECHGFHPVDFLDEEYDLENGARFDLIIGNPPYSHAAEFIGRSLNLLKPDGRLVFLLRLAYLETKTRFQWWKTHMPASVTVLAERPSFSGYGSAVDSSAYAIFVWDPNHVAPTELYVESWKGS
jgi:SAM-dependent methyltransferase